MPTKQFLKNANDVSEHILVLVANCVEDWFADELRVTTEGGE